MKKINDILIEKYISKFPNLSPHNYDEYRSIKYSSITMIIIGIILVIFDIFCNYFISKINIFIILFNIIILFTALLFYIVGNSMLENNKRKYRRINKKKH